MAKPPQPSFIESLLSRFKAKQPAKMSSPSQVRPFQAISVHHGTICCATAKQISGYRFLARSAPQLPLSDCTMREKCECCYLKHKDRRGDSRRLNDYGLKQQLFAAKEQRIRRGRRAKD